MIPQHKGRDGQWIETPREHYERVERQRARRDIALTFAFVVVIAGAVVWLA